MEFEDFKKDSPQDSTVKELEGVEAFSSLALLFEKILKLEQKGPRVLLAPDKSLKKIEAFFEFKQPNFPWFVLPPAPLTNSLFAEKIWNQRRSWLAWARHSTAPSLFLASPVSLLKRSSLEPPSLVLKKGDMLNDLEKLGYKQKSFVEKVGDFSSRGFLFDIYSPAHKGALRLEMMDDKITSLSLLSKDLKKRVASLEEALIPPLKEWHLVGETRKTLCKMLKEGFSKEDFPFRQDLLKKISRGDTPFGFEAVLNALDETCSLDFFPHKVTLWILEPEKQKRILKKFWKKLKMKRFFLKRIGFFFLGKKWNQSFKWPSGDLVFLLNKEASCNPLQII